MDIQIKITKLKATGLFLLGGVWLFGLSGCQQGPVGTDVEKPAVMINKLRLTSQDLKRELVERSLSVHEKEAAPGEEPEWLTRLIERELLVQEAQRLGLDREPDFMGTIERFWKEALIKHLLVQKGQEIATQVHVYEPEIEEYYNHLMKEQAGQPAEPLPVLRDEIQRRVRQEKETEAMERWVAELRTKAHVAVDQEALSHLQ